MAMHRAALLAIRRLAATAAVAAASPSPALVLAPLWQPATAAATSSRFLLQPITTMAGAPCARRGYAARGGAGRKAARAVSESEEDEDEEFEAVGSDGEFDGDFDDEDLDEFDDDDEDDDDYDAAPKRGRR
ncbi:uncharacterized protein C2845_PM12G10000 [Panicum miliaceum]|uniref:Uncharacterized protein n=1 Tax=Panicum miliaceum TaxID=4540 RepID=A0A3L6QJ52_PANMI|nr:uncharacterized protein C2845_PM12G10000 [Panicum miliaceum]